MKKKSVKEKSWVEKKLEDKDFRKGFASEYAKLSIGEQLAALRAFAKLTQAQVAKKAGTTASASAGTKMPNMIDMSYKP